MKSLDKLVDEFANTVMEQKEAMKSGTVTQANKLARKQGRVWEQLRANGNEGRDSLARLLTDERPDVRAMAAAYLLRYRTAEARRVLQEVAKGEGLAAFGAAQCLRRWVELEEKGDFNLDPDVSKWGGTFFASLVALKRHLGDPGPDKVWHPLVDLFYARHFGIELVLNTINMIAVPAKVGDDLRVLYASERLNISGATGLTVREWLGGKSYKFNRVFGLEVVRCFPKGIWP